MEAERMVEKEEFCVEGYVRVGSEVGAIITLIMGVAISTLLLIFTGTLGGQVYSQVEPDITSISDTNIQTYVKEAITSGFKAQQTVGNYLPIIVLAVVVFIVIGLVLALGQGTGAYGGYYGGVL